MKNIYVDMKNAHAKSWFFCVFVFFFCFTVKLWKNKKSSKKKLLKKLNAVFIIVTIAAGGNKKHRKRNYLEYLIDLFTLLAIKCHYYFDRITKLSCFNSYRIKFTLKMEQVSIKRTYPVHNLTRAAKIPGKY